MNRLAGKVALISGAASGIGLATALRFAGEGAAVVLADRDDAGLERALAQMPGEGHVAQHLDVTVEADWVAAMAAIDSGPGRLDVLFNNAGFGRFRSIVETTLEEWRSIIAVNLDSVFLGTKHALPLLAKSGRGAIVNMSSMRGLRAGANAGSYCAAKAGVHLFTKVTALECAAAGNGVRANSVHPGHIETPLTAAAYANPELAQRFIGHTPLARFGRAAEIADAVLFLASDESSYMTGAELVVDGGVLAQ
ncbi:MAG: SDR family oxidoreductase [Burkholderiales bacterium]|nr:SDR family oxidoreductase [Burkholderiales bacterium]MDE1927190.1 SDR family oxidoreductase [Burkholderiales bacterium]MDE2158431.1 SDR family oxidoreductase [Burkholderiales bacterium]MDE2505042.1 SDR family oxidoreductase [Burkholderiales bacterium]